MEKENTRYGPLNQHSRQYLLDHGRNVVQIQLVATNVRKAHVRERERLGHARQHGLRSIFLGLFLVVVVGLCRWQWMVS